MIYIFYKYPKVFNESEVINYFTNNIIRFDITKILNQYAKHVKFPTEYKTSQHAIVTFAKAIPYIKLTEDVFTCLQLRGLLRQVSTQ